LAARRPRVTMRVVVVESMVRQLGCYAHVTFARTVAPRIYQLAGTGCSGGPGSPSNRLLNRGANMFRLPATVAVFLGRVLSAATCPPAGQVLPANDKKAWQEAELKQLAGRWTTFREEKADQDKISRRRVDLEFVDGKLKVFFFDEKGVKVGDGSLKV